MLYGFDVGGTKIAFAVYDQNLNCLFEHQIPTPIDYSSFITFICDIVYQADDKYSVKGEIGLGLPGTINSEGILTNCANIPVISGRPLINDLSVALARQINFDNDANCFLLSECFGGSTDSCATVLGVTLGTGVGGAIFVNGRILKGKNASAGEIGHYPLPATILKKYPELPDLTCGCGRHMCLETYVSGMGLANLYKHYVNEEIQSPAVLNLFRTGDKMAKKVVDVYFNILAAGLATAILVLDADAIVFGGGLSKFEILLEELVKRLPEHLLDGAQLPLLVTAKFGAEGGVRGAALLNYKTSLSI
jgi:N-acetylglucosamine kinase